MAVLGGAFPTGADSSDNGIERAFDIDTGFCRCFDEFAAEVFCHLKSFFTRHFPFGDLVAFVANEDDGYCVNVFDSEDLVAESLDSFKRRSGRNRVHQQEAFAVPDPLVS